MNKNYKKITLLTLSALLLLNLASPIFANTKEEVVEELKEHTEAILDAEDISDVEEELIEEVEMFEEGHMDLGLFEKSEDVNEEALDEVIEDAFVEVIDDTLEEEIEVNSPLKDERFNPDSFNISFSTPGIALINGVKTEMESLYIPGRYDFGAEGVRNIVLSDTKILKNKTKHLIIEEVDGVKVGLDTNNLELALQMIIGEKQPI